MLTYTKLWMQLEKRGMQKTDLLKNKVISSATLAKLGKNETVQSTVIEKICDYLNCQPGDIMENVTKEDIAKAGEIMNEKIAEMMNVLTATTGMSKEALLNEFMNTAPTFIEKLKNGEKDILGVSEFMKENE